MSGIVQHLSFCNWLISHSIMSPSFIHVVACKRISFLFKAELYSIVWAYHICFSIHPSVIIWVASPSWLLWKVLLWAWVYEYLFKTLLLIILNIYPEVESLEYAVILLLISRGTAILFPSTKQLYALPILFHLLKNSMSQFWFAFL